MCSLWCCSWKVWPWVSYNHPGMTVVLAGLSLTVSFPDHTHLLSSTNYWLIALLFSTVSCGINCLQTIQSNLGSFEEIVHRVNVWDLSWSQKGFFQLPLPLVLSDKPASLHFSLCLQWIYLSPSNWFSSQPPLFLRAPLGLNFSTLSCTEVSFLWEDTGSLLLYSLSLPLGKQKQKQTSVLWLWN